MEQYSVKDIKDILHMNENTIRTNLSTNNSNHRWKEPQNADKTLSNMEYFKRYMSKKYFIDATTGEIIGGEQAQFNLK